MSHFGLKIDPKGCSKCGLQGLHACPGKPIEPLTTEKEAELDAALRYMAEKEGRVLLNE